MHANNGAFLDIACGDNELVLGVAQTDEFSLVVGNDVSWSQIQLLAQRPENAALRDHAALTLFTNHDARHLPFADTRFSVGFAKNVLHHMDGLPSVRALVDELIRVSKVAIVVEVMDPAVESRWGRRNRKGSSTSVWSFKLGTGSYGLAVEVPSCPHGGLWPMSRQVVA
jgi:ubiquinone/menaquinone biosynthesis C-methylase UbiE